ncbi:MAG: hypothetical protein RIE53_13515, partial [Rhodothermales bacterium]
MKQEWAISARKKAFSSDRAKTRSGPARGLQERGQLPTHTLFKTTNNAMKNFFALAFALTFAFAA